MTEPKGIISRETLVPLGVVAGVLIFISGIGYWTQETLARVSQQFSELGHKLDIIQRDLSGLANRVDGTWTRADMRNWRDLLQAQNGGTVKVPEVPK